MLKEVFKLAVSLLAALHEIEKQDSLNHELKRVKEPVLLFIYDISVQEVQYDSIGRRIVKNTFGNLYHSSLVVFDREYFVQKDGIYVAEIPGESRFGSPVAILPLGETKIDEETFHRFINRIKYSHHEGKYDVIHNNCNDFSQKLYRFLLETNSDLPKWVNQAARNAKQSIVAKVANFFSQVGIISLASSHSVSSYSPKDPAKVRKWEDFILEEFEHIKNEEANNMHQKVNNVILGEITYLPIDK